MFVNKSPATLNSICLLPFFCHFGQTISPVLTCYMTFFNTHDSETNFKGSTYVKQVCGSCKLMVSCKYSTIYVFSSSLHPTLVIKRFIV